MGLMENGSRPWPLLALMLCLWGCATPETYLCTYEVRGQEDGVDFTENVDYEVCSTEDLTGSGVAAANTLMVAVDCDSIEGYEQLDDVACDPVVCEALSQECDSHAEATRVNN